MSEKLQSEVPRHIGIILDGNRRWARAAGKPTFFGHKAGMENIRRIIDHAQKRGVEMMTVFAFSTENWKRSAEEVGYLMDLFEDYARKKMAELDKEQVKIRVMGDVSRFRPSLQKLLAEMVEKTKDHTRFTFVMCLSYGGRDEILRAIEKILREAGDRPTSDVLPAHHLRGVTPVSSKVEGGAGATSDVLPRHIGSEGGSLELTDEIFAHYLDSAGLPDPDMIIRTSGEQRLSGFLTWQAVYSELYFSPVHWPAFDEAALDKALAWYADRHRRYGK